MIIDVRADVREVERMLGRIGRDIVPKGTERALNNVSFAGREALQQHMQQVFDRPTQFTLNAPFVNRARRHNLTAEVTLQGKFINDIEKSFLAAQVRGGARKPKRMEQLLRSRGMLGADEFLAPSKFQPLDAFGNVPRSVVQKVLANLQANFDPKQNTPTGGARGGKKKGEYFFTRKGIKGARLTAIWRRTGAGNAIPAFVVTRAPKYRKRLAFEATVNRAVIEKWPREFERAVAYEISKL